MSYLAEKINKKKILPILFIISMMIAFTTRYGDYELDYKPQLIIGIIWIIIAFFKFRKDHFKLVGVFKNDYIWLLIIYISPHIIIHLYSIFLMLIGKVSWSYFSSNATVYIPALLAIVSIYLFGTNSFKFIITAFLGSWLLSVGSSILLKGIQIFPHALLQAYYDPADEYAGLTVNYLELHDLILASGYLIIAYIFSYKKLEKQNLIYIISLAIIVFLGMKRIVVIGLAFAFLFYLLMKRCSDKSKYKICLFLGWCAFAFCFLFIFILSDGTIFYEFLEKFGIESMGRNYYYQSIMTYGEFSPTFLGIGRNVITNLLSNELSYLRVRGVHSDIIKMYIENGFILFGLWLWYYLVFLFKKYNQKFGINSAVFYFACTIYTFTLYLTDNIEVYFICQLLYIIVPVCHALKAERRHKMKVLNIEAEESKVSL
jgi:hypothetical protein